MDDIIKNFQKRVGATTLVQLTVTGLSGHEDLLKFKSILQSQIRGVEGIHERSFSGDVAKMELDIKGSAQSLSEEITRKTFKEFEMKVISSTWNTIVVSITPR
jgi:VIT1/CCC1 family predicted Fe2+/Mn2+ transporter